jgi:2-iminoacetate synthase
MFSQELAIIENHIVSMISQRPSVGKVDEILAMIKQEQILDLSQVWHLLNVDTKTEKNDYKSILELSCQLKASTYRGNIFAIVPLYVTSICQEQCVYCNYRAGNKDKEIQRLRLSNEELAIEVEFLVKKGLKVIELVYATDPFITVNDVTNHIKITRDILSNFGGGMVGMNARPYSVEDYRKLKESGLDFVVLWQETYDEIRYKELHPGNTEKTDFYYRLNAPERMLQAGIENIGLGVLSGLSDWRKDWWMLISHVDYLLREYKDKMNAIILGIPRLKPAAGALLKETPFIPDEKEYLLAISVFNLFLPTALPFVNTRESWDMCIEIAKGGGTLFTFNCKTIPGGYLLGRHGYQFPTFDFSVDKYVRKLNGNDLNPIFHWSFKNFNSKQTLVRKLFEL